ncbi:Telomerase-binding protein [Extremus antarcticus]|uniref:Telomerase-binding protein n=1 Tax=Extremus antarcticus TaxID=702011 RepID=A0AAJ0GG46_9PEZI|nr:Telomerase-binding protein [Extremus antarcticus]
MPYAQSWLDWEAASGGRACLKGSPEEIRAQYDGLVAALIPMMPPMPEGVDVAEGDVDGVKYRTYTPQEGSGPFPIAIWTHGGGYMTGDLNADHFFCLVVALQTKSAVVNIDYRLAPETKWPGQLEDCMKVYKWAVANASSFKGDASKVYTIGGSAGGALALQIANAVIREPGLKTSLRGIAAMVPGTTHWDNVPSKYKDKYKSYTENAKDTPIIDGESMDIFYKHVGADPKDPGTFTILATDKHSEFPPVYMTSCEFDPLRDDATIMELALKEAGVPVKHDYWAGFPHYFWIIPPVPEGQQYVGKLIEGIEWLKSQM